jgi:hypothetical protein
LRTEGTGWIDKLNRSIDTARSGKMPKRVSSESAGASDDACTDAESHLEAMLDAALSASFPASDPIALQVAPPVALTRPAPAPRQALVCTIGHSNRPLDEFLDLLRDNGITHLLDVRTVPRSRHNPHFAQDSLPHSLQDAGISYTHLASLGGLRRTRPDSPNAGWRNTSFRGYADYMQTEEFRAQVESLVRQAPQERFVLMCAEAVPWRCHRSLIADALLVRGVRVEHIIGPQARKPHSITSFAQVDGTNVTYPAY